VGVRRVRVMIVNNSMELSRRGLDSYNDDSMYDLSQGRFENCLNMPKATNHSTTYSVTPDYTISRELPASDIVCVTGLLPSRGSRAKSESGEELRTSYGDLAV